MHLPGAPRHKKARLAPRLKVPRPARVTIRKVHVESCARSSSSGGTSGAFAPGRSTSLPQLRRNGAEDEFNHSVGMDVSELHTGTHFQVVTCPYPRSECNRGVLGLAEGGDGPRTAQRLLFQDAPRAWNLPVNGLDQSQLSPPSEHAVTRCKITFADGLV